MHTHTSPATGQAAAAVAAFVHQPRPAHVSGEHPKQRRFGATLGAARIGMPDRTGTWRLSVLRYATDQLAELRLSTTAAASVHIGVEMTPDAMRELARCLIDAAAEIDGGLQGGAA